MLVHIYIKKKINIYIYIYLRIDWGLWKLLSFNFSIKHGIIS